MATALLRTCVIGMKYIVLISADVIQDGAFHANDRGGSHWRVKVDKVDSVRCEGRESSISIANLSVSQNGNAVH